MKNHHTRAYADATFLGIYLYGGSIPKTRFYFAAHIFFSVYNAVHKKDLSSRSGTEQTARNVTLEARLQATLISTR